MAIAKEIEIKLYRGDKFTHDFTVTKQGMTWTNVTLRSQIRDGIDGALLFTPTLTPTVSGDAISFQYEIPAATTATFSPGDKLYSDIELTADGFGPFTFVRIIFHVIGDITT